MSDPRDPKATKCLPGFRPRGDSARGRAPRRPLVKYAYRFGRGTADGDQTMKDLLGGKGAGLAEMSRIGLNVPPGFTISTEVCELYSAARAAGDADATRETLAPVWDEMRQGIAHIERCMGRRLARFPKASSAKSSAGSSSSSEFERATPLLVSVRSGAAASMPGMMDTVLNIGLNDEVVATMLECSASDDERRFALDAYRRLLDMFGDVVLGVPHEAFEAKLASAKASANVTNDADLDSSRLEALIRDYKSVYAEHGRAFPSDPLEQLEMAVEAVFRSWNNNRAVKYRKINRVLGLRGTAVNVQAMVFGNTGDESASGVCFTRNPSTGEKRLFGEFLVCSQGEDVVAGIRTPEPVDALASRFPAAFAKLEEDCDALEEHFKDMMDIEFTIEREKLYILQCRAGKRTGRGALRVAIEMVDEGLCTIPQALASIEPRHVDQLLHPSFDPEDLYANDVVAKGLPASPGAAVGAIVFDAAEAEARRARKEDVLLVRTETSAEDVGGMHAARGILTARGGKTSHAAVVARGWGKPCVVGCDSMRVDETGKTVTFDGGDSKTFGEGDVLSVDGETGEVIGRAVRLGKPSSGATGDLATITAWADEYKDLRVLANADTPEDAATAMENGAEGIGLTRTEHMWFETAERTRAIRRMILAPDDVTRRDALEAMLAYQREDFEKIFLAAKGAPVTVRLLDPPLHEFLPAPGDDVGAFAAKHGKAFGATPAAIVERAESLREANPMLGARGCRLGIARPDVTRMQVRAVFEAAAIARREATRDESRVAAESSPRVGVMVPLVSTVEEFVHQRDIVRSVAEEVSDASGEPPIQYEIGLMIETPRAALVAGELAASGADFFSFGTNDLTQMTFGLSRDDAAPILARYAAEGIFAHDPFQTIDKEGVGRLVRMCATSARAASEKLDIGVCGEHGGDARSVEFFDACGLDYVSCSPYRVSVARLSAAQAATKRKGLSYRT